MWASQYSKECQKNYEKSQSNVSTKQSSNLKNSQKQSKKSIHNCSFCEFSFVNEQILNEHILSLHVMPLNLKNSEPRDVEMIYSHEFPSMPPARASNVRVQVPKTSPNAQKPRPKYPTQQAQVANLVGPSAQNGYKGPGGGPASSRPRRAGGFRRQSLHQSNSTTTLGASEIPQPMQLVQCPLCSRSFEKHVIGKKCALKI